MNKLRWNAFRGVLLAAAFWSAMPAHGEVAHGQAAPAGQPARGAAAPIQTACGVDGLNLILSPSAALTPASSASSTSPASPASPATAAGPAAPLAGAAGEAVIELKRGLRELGFYVGPDDPVYTPELADAVRRFQLRAGLNPDGIAGPQTANALAQAYYLLHGDSFAQAAMLGGVEAAVQAGNRGAMQAALQAAIQASSATASPDAAPRPAAGVPEGPREIVIDVDRQTLTLYIAGKEFGRWPVAVGKERTPTPIGEWTVSRKDRDWGGGFGTRWLGLDVPWGVYGIHGTNKPWSIGDRASGGCIRMHNRDVEVLWPLVGEGTPVRIVGTWPTHFWGEALWERPVMPGRKFQEVSLLQLAMKARGIYAGRAHATYDEETRKAVASLQEAYGLPATGTADLTVLRLLGILPLK